MTGRLIEKRFGIAALCVVVLTSSVSTTAVAYQPLPWDVPPGSDLGYRPRDGTTRPRDMDVPRGPRQLFGTTGAFFDYSVTFDGHIPGISEGKGYTFDIPATLPAWVIYALLVDPVAMFSTLSPEAWTSGLRGRGLRSSPLFDEIDFEVLYSVSTHRDEIKGGDLEYTRVGLGVRLSGPEPTDRVLRGSLAVGWTWHDLDFDLRGDYTAAGPYVGLGLETRFAKDTGRGSKGRDSMISVRLSARWDFVRGPDNQGDDFDATLFTAGAGISFYW